MPSRASTPELGEFAYRRTLRSTPMAIPFHNESKLAFSHNPCLSERGDVSIGRSWGGFPVACWYSWARRQIARSGAQARGNRYGLQVLAPSAFTNRQKGDCQDRDKAREGPNCPLY